MADTTSIAPHGHLRIAVPVGPAPSATWCIRDKAAGRTAGVGVDLGRAIAQRLNIPAEIVDYSSSGAIVQDVGADHWDLTFIPADAERKKHVVFGPNYFLSESTYLVAADSGIDDIAGVDRAGLVVAGVENTATIRSVRRTVHASKIIGLTAYDEAIALYEKGEIDAFAMSRETLNNTLLQLTRAGKILDGNFHTAGNAPAVPLARLDAMTLIAPLLEQMKRDGSVADIFTRNGLGHLEVAPADSVP